MKQITLVFVAALAASALILGTLGTIQPAAAYHHHHHHHHHGSSVKQSNNIEVNQQNDQSVQCDNSVGSCNGNTQQGVNSASVTANQVNVNK